MSQRGDQISNDRNSVQTSLLFVVQAPFKSSCICLSIFWFLRSLSWLLFQVGSSYVLTDTATGNSSPMSPSLVILGKRTLTLSEPMG